MSFWLHISHILKKHLKDAHRNSVQNGCDTFPNELVWFHIEAKPIWDKIQKHSKTAVICKMCLWLVMSERIKKPYFLKNHCFGPSRNWTFPVTVMVLLKMDLPGHCYGPSKNWTSLVTVMVLARTGPPRSLLWSF